MPKIRSGREKACGKFFFFPHILQALYITYCLTFLSVLMSLNINEFICWPVIYVLCMNMYVYRVWSVRYNHFHDQLILSSSSDSRVILNNIVSLSSEPYGHLVENDEDSDEDKDDNRYQAHTQESIIGINP